MREGNIALTFRNFLVFSHVVWRSSSPITLILGPNRTGKTHILLTLFVFFKYLWLQSRLGEDSPSLRSLFLDTFLMRNPNDLRRWGTREEKFGVRFSWEGVVDLKYPGSFQTSASKISGELTQDQIPIPVYYAPAGLGDYYKSLSFVAKSFRNWRVISQAVVDLISTVLVGDREEDPRFVEMFRSLFGEDMKFSVERERIYAYEGKKKLKIERAASGVKSLSWLYLLGRAGVFRNAVLLADEPEVHFHPEYLLRFAGLLFSMTRMGTRIFLATHSDLLVAALNRWIELTGHTVSVWEIQRDMKGEIGSRCYEATRERLIDDRPLTDVYLDTIRLSEEVKRILLPPDSDG